MATVKCYTKFSFVYTFFFIECSATGKHGVATININIADVDLNCSVTCGHGKPTDFNLKGTLNFIEKDRIANLTSSGNSNENPSGGWHPEDLDISHLLNFLFGLFNSSLFKTVLMVILIAILFYKCAPKLINLLKNRRQYMLINQSQDKPKAS